MEELRRRMSSARAWGIPAELVTPDQVVERVPFLDKDKILGAFWTPSVGVVDSLRAGTLMRESALALGALTVVSTVEVGRHGRRGGPDPAGAHHRRRHRGRDRRDRLRRVEPEAREDGGRGDPAHARGAPDDLGGPDPAARRATGRDLVPDRPRHGHVLLRAPARRRHGGGLLRPPRRSSTTPRRSRRSSRRSCRPPSCRSRPTTSTRSWSRRSSSCPTRSAPTVPRSATRSTACSRSPRTAGRSSARRPRCKGLWSAAAVWIKEGPGVGRAVAEWMTHGHSEIDVHHSDIARFYPHQRTRAHMRARTNEASTRPTASCTPASSGRSERGKRLAPMHAAEQARGRGVLRDRRLGAADVVRVQRGAARRVRRRGSCRASTSGTPAGGRRSSTPSTSRCASAPASSTCPRSRSSTSSDPLRRQPSRASSSRRPTSPTAG